MDQPQYGHVGIVYGGIFEQSDKDVELELFLKVVLHGFVPAIAEVRQEIDILDEVLPSQRNFIDGILIIITKDTPFVVPVETRLNHQLLLLLILKVKGQLRPLHLLHKQLHNIGLILRNRTLIDNTKTPKNLQILGGGHLNPPSLLRQMLNQLLPNKITYHQLIALEYLLQRIQPRLIITRNHILNHKVDPLAHVDFELVVVFDHDLDDLVAGVVQLLELVFLVVAVFEDGVVFVDFHVV